MPVPATVPEFIDVIRKSGLVNDEKLRPEIDRWAAGTAAPGTPDQAATALLQAGVITKFQARQFKLGRYKRFTIAGKYRLLELLGVGGMGAVYLCEHVFMKRLVAIKVLPIEKLADPSNLERFQREARAVAALDHPNIVRAYDIDKAENLHFLVLEYVDGTSLQEIVARFGPLDPVRAANYIAQAAIGMHHAHELGMVHRDIKPGNLLLDRIGTIKLLDMGLARFFNDKTDNLTAKYDDNCVLGTADYLAPEQALSNVVDIRADIYALGGTFYFMLTGGSPVPEGTVAHKLVFHQTQDPKPVSDLRPDVPPEMLAVLRKMMKKKPADRYQTPMEVADALAPWAEIPLPKPPTMEMPDLCPAVMVLTGHMNTPQRGGNGSARPTRAPRSGSAFTILPENAPLMPTSSDLNLGDISQSTVPTGSRGGATMPIGPPLAKGARESVVPWPATGQESSIVEMVVSRSAPADRRINKWLVIVIAVLALALIGAVALILTGSTAGRSG